MDLTTALALAKAGRGQASADPETLRPTERSEPQPVAPSPDGDEIIPRLEPGDFDLWCVDVAMELANQQGKEWYDLPPAVRDGYRKLARAAILAVSAANVQRTLSRIRDLRPVDGIGDLAEREAAAGISRGDVAA